MRRRTLTRRRARKSPGWPGNSPHRRRPERCDVRCWSADAGLTAITPPRRCVEDEAVCASAPVCSPTPTPCDEPASRRMSRQPRFLPALSDKQALRQRAEICISGPFSSQRPCLALIFWPQALNPPSQMKPHRLPGFGRHGSVLGAPRPPSTGECTDGPPTPTPHCGRIRPPSSRLFVFRQAWPIFPRRWTENSSGLLGVARG